MKILFVAMPFSIHTARWLSQLNGTGWEIHLYPSILFKPLHPELKGIIYHIDFYNNIFEKSAGNKYTPIHLPALSFIEAPLLKKGIRKFFSITGRNDRARELAELIDKIQPDIIHSLETQHAGYLVKEARLKVKTEFPVWVHSNWGIDLHFFGRLKEQGPLIKETLSGIDLLLVEGKRDEQLAREFGFKGLVHTFPSVGGGFIIPKKPVIAPSARKKILIKGTQDFVRRGMVGLGALEQCIDVIKDYEVVMYSANDITKAGAELFYRNTGKKITVVEDVNQQGMLQLNSEARISLCVNLSDGLPNAMLEAMMMGAFPIQSDTSVADEWIQHGKTGMLVPPEDKDAIAIAIRKALHDDKMVDNAAMVNRKLIEERLDYNMIKNAVIKMYSTALTLQN